MKNISTEIRNELERRYRIASFVVIAQICVAAILIGLAFLLAQTSENSVTSQSLFSLWLVVLFIAAGSFVLRRVLFSWARLQNVAVLRGISAVLQTLQVNAIFLGSLAELVALIGFLLAVLSGDKWDMFRAGAVSFIVFLANFPRKSAWEKIVGNLREV